MITILSLNVGRARALTVGDKEVPSGIVKAPVQEAEVTKEGLLGDEQGDRKNHGGPDQAVYLYSAADYAWWAQVLGRPLEPGAFGENVTLSGFGELPSSREVRVGDRFEVGGERGVVIEATAPRIPCSKLAAKLGDPGFVKRFAEAELPGVYTRVLQSGRVRVGDPVTYIPNPDEAPTVGACFRWFYEKRPDQEAVRRALLAPLGVRLRRHLEGKI